MASEKGKESLQSNDGDPIDIDLGEEFSIPSSLPLLPVRDIVVFPYMIIPLFVGRKKSLAGVTKALEGDRMILLSAQKDPAVDNPTEFDLYEIGTVAVILRMLSMPDGRAKILVQGIGKAKIGKFLSTDPLFEIKAKQLVEKKTRLRKSERLKIEARMRSVRHQLQKAVNLGKHITPDIMVIAENIDEPGRLADLVASNLGLKVDQAQGYLELLNPLIRLEKVGEFLNREIDLLGMQQKIETAAQGEISKSQREYYLREQLKAIQSELGLLDDKDRELDETRERIEKAGMPAPVYEEVSKQLNRLYKMQSSSAEATTVRTYIEWMVDIPWSVFTEDNLNLDFARAVLDKDHYDLEKVKNRIIEYLAVRKLRKEMKGPILCLAGPPGVGKTSLGQSIARALGRKFVRISVGGLRDEAEIRGHRRTYIGALPGKIVQGLKQAGSINPVFMLDEIDKLGNDFRGDPSSALLEVLDPEQNFAFTDHYLGVAIDLSKVMFITTANMTDTITPALLDRMEVMRLPGYTQREKVMIAKRHIVPRQIKEHGLTRKHVKITDSTLAEIVRSYTREAGLRNLEREIAHLLRKVAGKVARGRTKKHEISPADITKYLGPVRYVSEKEIERDTVGVATGLAWTRVGGEIMHIETTPMRGNGKLILTGKLGDVMKESAQAALSYVRSRSDQLHIPEDFSQKTDLHIHFPAGAVPKDGPSAGVTIAVAITSALSNRPVRKDVAMTGELTLRGSVLPIGGLKEKCLAAHRAGIFEVIIPDQNKKDLIEIPESVRKKIKFRYAKNVEQVIKWALLAGKEKEKKG